METNLCYRSDDNIDTKSTKKKATTTSKSKSKTKSKSKYEEENKECNSMLLLIYIEKNISSKKNKRTIFI